MFKIFRRYLFVEIPDCRKDIGISGKLDITVLIVEVVQILHMNSTISLLGLGLKGFTLGTFQITGPLI